MVKAGAWVYKLRDCPTWGQGDGDAKRRFTPSNLADFAVFLYDTLFIVECKSVMGKSIRWDAVKHKHLMDMVKANEHTGIQAGVLVEFRGTGDVVWVHADTWLHELGDSQKQSFNVKDAELFADDWPLDKGWKQWLISWLRSPNDYQRGIL
jgi:hypothetical protein